MRKNVKSVDEYISTFPTEVSDRLNSIRKIILENAPGAIEQISYGMPAYKTFKKPLVYFCGYDRHIGFYATPNGHREFADELKVYKQGKGSVQFPHDKPIPADLIARMVRFRVKENEVKFKSRK
ncbi:MAG TPA: hypothetical protein DCX54_09795 [Flavobacteriales bacterium]|nr:hypothetical protein [Flavobacteriales bacterium]